MKLIKLYSIGLLFFPLLQYAQLKTSFISNYSYGDALKISLADTKVLLDEYSKELKEAVDLKVMFYKIEGAKAENTSKIEYPEHNYTLNYAYNISKGEATLQIESPSEQGLVFGLYGFLQQKLKIKFYHPKNTHIPQPKRWMLNTGFTQKANPRFALKGFHLHTQHPLELTEYLMEDKWGEKGQQEVKEYFDWLVRNGQNYFQFFLLESINEKKWIPYFKPLEEYAHKRGIVVGVNVSLHMIQQKAYTLYKNWPNSWLGRKKQISNRIERLNQIKWDYWTIDFKTHEFTKDKSKRIDRLKLHVYEELKKYGVTIGEHYHVVNTPDHLMVEPEGKEKEFMDNSAAFIHTVMFYTVTDEKAPVYENDNLLHMQKKLLNAKNANRETWYFPESAYWVTFDNSVPMMLTPYLNARLTDIQTMEKFKVDAHLTFSSGWEWGYWLNDWSIAQWCWDYNEVQQSYQYLRDIVDNEAMYIKLETLAKLQQEYIKDSNLIEFLTAQAVTDEAPKWIFNKEFHPRPPFSYKVLRNSSTPEQIAYAKNSIQLLHQFVTKSEAVLYSIPETDNPILKELIDGFKITVLRAKHRENILEYLIVKRQQQSRTDESKLVLDDLMTDIVNIRMEAQKIVDSRIKEYRYPNIIIGNKYKGKTSYGFGYLYPVKNLHFWEREELQAKKNKYKVRFRNIYNLMRIGGLIN